MRVPSGGRALSGASVRMMIQWSSSQLFYRHREVARKVAPAWRQWFGHTRQSREHSEDFLQREPESSSPGRRVGQGALNGNLGQFCRSIKTFSIGGDWQGVALGGVLVGAVADLGNKTEAPRLRGHANQGARGAERETRRQRARSKRPTIGCLTAGCGESRRVWRTDDRAARLFVPIASCASADWPCTVTWTVAEATTVKASIPGC